MKKTIAIVYHSTYGHTEALAKSVLAGVLRVEGIEAKLVKAAEAKNDWEYLNGVDAIIFGCPTYMGSTSAEFKKFMEDSSGIWAKQRWKDKLAAGFTNSGSQSGDKLNTLTDLIIFAAQHSMLWVSLGLLPGNNTSKSSVEDINRLGSFLGAMAQSNNDQGPDKAPPPNDHETAALLGQRVAELTKRFN